MISRWELAKAGNLRLQIPLLLLVHFEGKGKLHFGGVIVSETDKWELSSCPLESSAPSSPSPFIYLFIRTSPNGAYPSALNYQPDSSKARPRNHNVNVPWSVKQGAYMSRLHATWDKYVLAGWVMDVIPDALLSFDSLVGSYSLSAIKTSSPGEYVKQQDWL